jgi:hypothetical protein
MLVYACLSILLVLQLCFQGVCSLCYSRELVLFSWFVYACTFDSLVSSCVLFLIYIISYI